jgi:hypothetical protein
VTINMGGSPIAGLAVTAHDNTQVSSVTMDSVAFSTSSIPGCPAPWTCAAVGAALPPGSQSVNGGLWTFTAGGADIWGTQDAFDYTCQTLSLGSGSISARVASLSTSNAWAKTGPMLRTTLDPGSPYYGVFVTPGNGVAVQWRSAQGGNTSQVRIAGVVPLYLQALQTGTTFSAFTSQDGQTWTLVPNSTVTIDALGGPILEGLAVTSHTTAAAVTVTMDAVTPS